MKLPGGVSIPVNVSPASVVRAGLGLLVLVALVAVVGMLLREPIATFSAALIDDLGLVGLLLAFVVTDPMPGLGFQPVMFLGYTGGVGPTPLLLTGWLGSMCASVLVYALGRALRGRPVLVRELLRWRIGHWLQAYGARAIAVAAIAPVPFGVATFGAGVMGVGLRDLLVGASVRVVKMALTLGAIVAGWGVGG